MNRAARYNRSMLRFLLAGPVAFAASLLLACSRSPPPPPAAAPVAAPPVAALARLVDEYWDESQRLNPRSRSAVVRYEAASGYDISPQFLADSLDRERRYRAALEAVPRAALDAESQLTYDIFKRERDIAIEGYTYPAELMPVNPFRSVPLEFARAGAGVGSFAILSSKDYESWRARAADFERWTVQAIANMREGLRRGYALPRVVVARLLPTLAVLGSDTPANLFYRPLSGIPPSLKAEERQRISSGIDAAVKATILPSYRRLHDFLQDEYLPRARETIALSALPLGPAWYAHLVRRETASQMTPAEIHALGAAETEKLRARLQSLLAEAGFAGNAQAYFEALEREPRVSYQTPEELLDFYAQLKVSAAAALAAEFAQAPQDDFLISAAEPFHAGAAPALFYERSTNHGAAAVLYVDMRPPLVPRAAGFLRAALPGQHLQLAIQQERSGLPKFRRFGGDPGFVEGWGLYAESLGEELGLYKDTESRFASLRDELACAAGLVVDTGVHGLGWSRAQAVEYFHAEVPTSEDAASEAVDRVIALPAEALDCGMGMRVFKGLRAHAQQVLGARFDLRDFHAELIDDGAMPLDLLETAANLWLSARH
jgi:uncharacterized protein (DUF885 family)